MSDDYNAGFRAGLNGSIFGAPATAQGSAGFMAGQATARTKYEGNIEWLVAPFVLWPFVLLFYPIGGLATVATAYVVEQVGLAIGLGHLPGLLWALIIVATVVVCWTLVRREQRWGLNPTYYRARQVVRLLLLALLANGAATNGARTTHDLPALPGWDAAFVWPPQWLPMLVFVAFWQVLFMRADLLRRYWNSKLIMWRFRPKDFPAFYHAQQAAPAPTPRQEPIEMPKFGGR